MANNAKKYPDLWAKFQDISKEVDTIEQEAKPLVNKRDKLHIQVAPLRDKILKLTEKIKELQGQRYIDLLNQKSALAKAMGGRVLSEKAE